MTVFSPAYNDEHTTGGRIRTSLAFLPQAFAAYEVIAVKDGDRGGAFQTGSTAPSRAPAFYIDTDGQHPRFVAPGASNEGTRSATGLCL